MAAPKHDWDAIFNDYLSGKYKNLKDIAEKNKDLTYFMVRKRSKTHRWYKKRKQMMKRVQTKVEKKIEENTVKHELKAREIAFKTAERVAKLLVNLGYQRFIDPETNLPIKGAIKNPQTAVTSMTSGAKLLMRLHGIGKGEEDVENTNIINIQTGEVNTRGIPDGELREVHSLLARRFGYKGANSDQRRSNNEGKRKSKSA